MNTQHRKGAKARLKALSIEKEEKEQELQYVTGKTIELETDIKKMLDRINHYRSVSIPSYMERAVNLNAECNRLHGEIESCRPMADEETAHESKQARIAELESELRKLQKA